MITVVKRMTGKKASDGYAGDINGFLTSLFLELATENYRQSLAETILTADSHQLLDPPLRGSESEVTGLFASAFSRIAGLAQPEPTLKREVGNGKLDYLVWYQNRTIAFELKAIRIDSRSKAIPKKLANRLSVALRQAEEAQAHLRGILKEDKRVKSPVALAVVLVTGYSSFVPEDNSTDADEERLFAFQNLLCSDFASPRPQFVATYSVPAEFKCIASRSKGKANLGKCIYVPYYAMLARARINVPK